MAYICRRRLTCLLAMDRCGTVAAVEEAVWGGETGGMEVDSPPPYGMVCRLVVIGQRACYCVICEWHTYADDVWRACWQWMGLVPSLLSTHCCGTVIAVEIALYRVFWSILDNHTEFRIHIVDCKRRFVLIYCWHTFTYYSCEVVWVLFVLQCLEFTAYATI